MLFRSAAAGRQLRRPGGAGVWRRRRGRGRAGLREKREKEGERERNLVVHARRPQRLVPRQSRSSARDRTAIVSRELRQFEAASE